MMRNLAKYGKTFGVIFGAAFIVSGVNSLIVKNTDTPSIANYSVTQDFAERIVDAFGGANASGAVSKASMQSGKADVLAAGIALGARAGS